MLHIGVIGERELVGSYEALLANGLSEASVRRYRTSLSALFGWAVRERLIPANPVLTTRVPRSSALREEMKPLREDELGEDGGCGAATTNGWPT